MNVGKLKYAQEPQRAGLHLAGPSLVAEPLDRHEDDILLTLLHRFGTFSRLGTVQEDSLIKGRHVFELPLPETPHSNNNSPGIVRQREDTVRTTLDIDHQKFWTRSWQTRGVKIVLRYD